MQHPLAVNPVLEFKDSRLLVEVCLRMSNVVMGRVAVACACEKGAGL